MAKLLPSVAVNVDVKDKEVVYSKQCSITDKLYSVTITKQQFVSIMKNELIQRVLTDKSADEREFIISGLTPAEWDDLFQEKKE